MIIHQFNKYDAGKKVVISDDRSIFTLVDKSSVVTINNSDVEKVELYEQKSLGKFGTYSYMIIYTNDRKKLLVTQFTIPRLAYDNILQSFLRKKSRFYFKKTFNYIDEKQFKSID
ncbi:MAG TPA: hypothetical protein VK668_19650 [Mucilaginibacter sp.]|nr:hypothetical protein [Mucilaginibacter sp.]